MSWKSSRHLRGRWYLWLLLRIFRMERITVLRPPYASWTHERVTSLLDWVAVTNIYRNPVSGRNLVATYVEISIELCILCTCKYNVWYHEVVSLPPLLVFLRVLHLKSYRARWNFLPVLQLINSLIFRACRSSRWVPISPLSTRSVDPLNSSKLL